MGQEVTGHYGLAMSAQQEVTGHYGLAMSV